MSYMKIWGQGFLVGETTNKDPETEMNCYTWGPEEQQVLEQESEEL